jgi:uncharacterized membrane protein
MVSFMTLKSFESNSRVIAFVAIMVALGNALAAFSIGLTKIGQVGLDLSHIATFIAAIYGGPFAGFLTGLLGGIVPGIYYGPMSGLSWLGLIGLPIGKSLTGLTTGALYKFFNVNQKPRPSLFTIPIVLVGFVPESLFTVVFFLNLVPYFLGWLSIPLLITILIKAWIEISVMSALMGALAGNGGFKNFMASFVTMRKVE